MDDPLCPTASSDDYAYDEYDTTYDEFDDYSDLDDGEVECVDCGGECYSLRCAICGSGMCSECYHDGGGCCAACEGEDDDE